MIVGGWWLVADGPSWLCDGRSAIKLFLNGEHRSTMPRNAKQAMRSCTHAVEAFSWVKRRRPLNNQSRNTTICQLAKLCVVADSLRLYTANLE